MGYLNSTGLARFFAKLSSCLEGKLDITQGAANSGKIPMVNSSGKLVMHSFPDRMYMPLRDLPMGDCYIDEDNCSDSEYEFDLTRGSSFKEGAVYAAEIHFYFGGGDIYSTMCFAQYTKADSGDGRLNFENALYAGNIMIRINWMLNVDKNTVTATASKGMTSSSIENLFNGTGLTDFDMVVWQVQEA